MLGPGNEKIAGTPIADGIGRVAAAMHDHDVDRLVVSATFSVPDPADRRTLLQKAMVGAIRRFVPHAYREIVTTGEVVRDSGLDWTLVRVGLLNNGPATPQVAAGRLGPDIGTRLSRANFAAFMLDTATESRWSRQAPALSEPR